MPCSMHDGFNRVNTGLNGIRLATRHNGDGCKRLLQSVPASLVNGQVTPGIFARPYTVIRLRNNPRNVCTSLAGTTAASLLVVTLPITSDMTKHSGDQIRK